VQRPAAVLGGVDDEVLAADQAADRVAVLDLVQRPVEVGGVQEEALDQADAGAAQQAGHVAGALRAVGGAGVLVDDEAWDLGEDLVGVAQHCQADGEAML
jgi:hypothetical protein